MIAKPVQTQLLLLLLLHSSVSSLTYICIENFGSVLNIALRFFCQICFTPFVSRVFAITH